MKSSSEKKNIYFILYINYTYASKCIYSIWNTTDFCQTWFTLTVAFVLTTVILTQTLYSQCSGSLSCCFSTLSPWRSLGKGYEPPGWDGWRSSDWLLMLMTQTGWHTLVILQLARCQTLFFQRISFHQSFRFLVDAVHNTHVSLRAVCSVFRREMLIVDIFCIFHLTG